MQVGHTTDGTLVERVEIEGGGLRASILTYGALIQDLRLEGHAPPLVLGFRDFAPYLTHSPYFGATVGRCANRIRDGHVIIEGREYQLDRNFLGKHMLHGGAGSIGKRVWRIEAHTRDSVTLGITLEDGEMGFPGRVQAQVHYRLQADGVLDIVLEADTDAPTLCNLAHHSYFVLDDSASIQDHRLRIDAAHYLPVDDELIPTGEIRPVDGTGFDFREFAPVAQARPLDHNFCLSVSRQALRPVAWLQSPVSGLRMTLCTTEPGLQVYDGTAIDIDIAGLDGRPMRAHAGIAMEPQVWPDANHHPDFPQALLLPGEHYHQHTQYIFTKDTP